MKNKRLKIPVDESILKVEFKKGCKIGKIQLQS